MLYFNGALCFWTLLPPYLVIGLFTVKDSCRVNYLPMCVLSIIGTLVFTMYGSLWPYHLLHLRRIFYIIHILVPYFFFLTYSVYLPCFTIFMLFACYLLSGNSSCS